MTITAFSIGAQDTGGIPLEMICKLGNSGDEVTVSFTQPRGNGTTQYSIEVDAGSFEALLKEMMAVSPRATLRAFGNVISAYSEGLTPGI